MLVQIEPSYQNFLIDSNSLLLQIFYNFREKEAEKNKKLASTQGKTLLNIIVMIVVYWSFIWF